MNVVCAIIVTGRDDSRELLLTTLVLCENSRSKGNRHLSARPEQISSNARTQEGGEEDLVEVPKQTAYSIGTNPTNNKGGFRVQKKIQPPIGTRNLILYYYRDPVEEEKRDGLVLVISFGEKSFFRHSW